MLLLLKSMLFVAMTNEEQGSGFFKRRKQKKEQAEQEYEYKTGLLCRFVFDGSGKKIGESVSIEEDVIIIKSGSQYLGVPLKHIEETGKTLLVKGLVDFEKALELGEKWRMTSFSEMSSETEGKDNDL